MVVVCMLMVFSISTAWALRFSGGPKYADSKLEGISPLKHMPGITQMIYLKNANKEEKKLHFKITFNKDVKFFDAFWAKNGDDKSENRSGVKIKNHQEKNGLHTYLVILDANSIISDKAEQIDFFLGCYSPAGGYPNLRKISIAFDEKQQPKVEE